MEAGAPKRRGLKRERKGVAAIGGGEKTEPLGVREKLSVGRGPAAPRNRPSSPLHWEGEKSSKKGVGGGSLIKRRVVKKA